MQHISQNGQKMAETQTIHAKNTCKTQKYYNWQKLPPLTSTFFCIFDCNTSLRVSNCTVQNSHSPTPPVVPTLTPMILLTQCEFTASVSDSVPQTHKDSARGHTLSGGWSQCNKDHYTDNIGIYKENKLFYLGPILWDYWLFLVWDKNLDEQKEGPW